MKKLILFLLVINIFALDKIQINVLKTAYKEASKYRAIDGHVFNDTVCSIVLTESSAGKQLIGDNYLNGKEKPFILKSLGVGQVKLETAIIIISKYKNQFKKYLYFIHKDKFAFKKYYKFLQNIQYFTYLKDKYKFRIKNKIGNQKRNLKVLRWVNRELKINKEKFKKYKKYYYKDLQLAQLLLSDLKFNIKIITFYLIYNYNNAIKKRYKNPWFITISRYNGGNHNIKYYNKILKNMKIIRNLKKQILK
jgi:hypothetical protein